MAAAGEEIRRQGVLQVVLAGNIYLIRLAHLSVGIRRSKNNVAILQSNRWEDICRRMISMTRGMGLSEEFVRTVLEAIHLESISRQNEIMNSKE